MDTKVHWYIDVNKFNIVWPTKDDINWDWPCLSWLFSIKIEGRFWTRFWLRVLITALFIVEFAAIDIAKRISADLIVYLVKVWVIDGIKKMFETVLDSVVKKFLGLIGIAVAIFLIYFVIKSGIWQSFYDWLLSLWQ